MVHERRFTNTIHGSDKFGHDATSTMARPEHDLKGTIHDHDLIQAQINIPIGCMWPLLCLAMNSVCGSGKHVFVFVVLFGVWFPDVFGLCSGVFGVWYSGSVSLCPVFGSDVVSCLVFRHGDDIS